ncbi:MAG: hypothetical protein HYR94_22975 [Chloroflexi bacterium]|nr:hypothetical protein [Chloroflexota bacterium]
MNSQQIKTQSDFRTFIANLIETKAASYQGTLEDYLRSLWKLIQQQCDEPASFALLANLLEEAFSTEPIPFDESWLSYTGPPAMVYPDQTSDDFGYVRDVILYQIADLHRLRLMGALDQPSWFGIKSPSCNHYWYNFYPETYLGCAIQGLSPSSDYSEPNWGDLAILLWIGQIYE